MASQPWTIYAAAKRKIGAADLDLNAGIFKMSLHRSAASTNIIVQSTRSLFSSIGNEISARGGYVAGGRTIPGVTWTTGASAKEIRWTYPSPHLIFWASGSSLIDIRYALIHASVGSVTSGFVLCFASLSSAQFTINSPNNFTVLAGGGVFTLT